MGDASSCQLKLFGSWADSYTHRVQLALKLKGLDFDYIEEDLASKSPSLLQHNPIYHKVPVLVHGDRPAIPESLIILQYIDETWPSPNPIMPSDPYDKALARFWSYFAEDKLGPAVGAVFATSGEDQRAAVERVHENLKLIEKEMGEGAFKGRRFFGGDKIGMLDIVLGCGSYWLAVFEEVAEVKLVDSESFPLFHSWLKEFEGQEAVKDIIPAFDKLIEYARGVRHLLLSINKPTAPVTAAPTEDDNDKNNNNDDAASA